jgi:UDP:flavonoid glycosyltransferase YjiC (YdhE family)
MIAALGMPGHAFPLVPLALALRDAGHDVTFTAGADVAEGIRGAGLDFMVSGIALGEALGKAMSSRGMTERPSDPALRSQLFADTFGELFPRATAADLLPVLERERPDLVIAEIGNPGAALAAARWDVPCVLHSLGRRLDGLMRVALGGRLSPTLAEVADEIGVRTLAEDAPLGHAYIDICPPSLQAPLDGTRFPVELPLRPTPWSPKADARPRRPDSGRPWVYLTLGTLFGNAQVLRTAVEGLTRLDVDVLLSAGGSADVMANLADTAGLTGRVRVEAFVPQADLLDQFDLVIHHGGSATTLGVAGVGAPQLFLPQGADQFGNATAVSAVGAGRLLVNGEVNADAIENAAGALLNDSGARDSARALAAEIAAMPAPSAVVADVAEWRLPSH